MRADRTRGPALDVDVEASPEVLEQRRRANRRRRRNVRVAVVAVALAVLGAVAIVGIGGNDTSVPFELLATIADRGETGHLVAVEDPAAISAALSDAGTTASTTRIDLRRWVVVSMSVDLDQCKDVPIAMNLDDGTVTPVFGLPPELRGQPVLCTLGAPIDGITHRFLVAIERAAVSPSFVLRLPVDVAPDGEEIRLTIDAGTTATRPPQDAVRTSPRAPP